MKLRMLLILAAVTMTVMLAASVSAAPVAQTSVDEVVIESTTAFTLTVMIDEVTTVAIPLQVDWRAAGPNPGNEEEVSVVISPRVLRTGFFSVTVASVEPSTGNLAITLVEPEDETQPITRTGTTTATEETAVPTTPITGTETTTGTAPLDAPAVDGPTANAISNLRAGPGTDFEIVGTAQAGDVLDIAGQSSDGTWFVLSNGSWIAAFLVNNPPVDLPIVESTAAPAPTASTVVTPTIIPTVTPTP